MRTPKTSRIFAPAASLSLAFVLWCAPLSAQTPPAEPKKEKPPAPTNRVIVENDTAAPQVVTILHRLNGLKFLRVVIRQGNQVQAIDNIDKAFEMSRKVHTSVIAGLALDDGRTIAAWLPEAEAELPPPMVRFAPRPPQTPRSTNAPEVPEPGEAPLALPSLPNIDFRANLLEPADLRVVTRDGKRVMGRYIGLDGLTGLSLITVSGSAFPQAAAVADATVSVGESLRIMGPQPAPRAEAGPNATIYVRMGQTDAMVTDVSRTPSGSIARIKIQSAKLSPANIGGIAIAADGKTLGIVDTVKGAEATIVPLALVRLAAERVMKRQASVPRPWLGISGEPIGLLPLERIVSIGWELERARALTEKSQGIMLTSVVPGSPAALAKLKPGDVILTVNNGFVRNAGDLSSLLDAAGPDNLVSFTVARPETATAEALLIKLRESPDLLLGWRIFDKRVEKAYGRGALRVEGLETVVLKPRVAERFGASSGLLVVSVQPTTDAFKAGLRPGDVIESIDGVPVVSSVLVITPKAADAKSTCVIVRQKERLVLRFHYATNDTPAKP